jgi:hypothetical protein
MFNKKERYLTKKDTEQKKILNKKRPVRQETRKRKEKENKLQDRRLTNIKWIDSES